MSSDRFQRPQTAAGAHSVTASELPPHPPDVRDEEVAEILATDFPIALRGYDRTAVDAYHQRVSRVIAELQAGRSPQSAVRYALEQVSEETRSILQQAHDTADQVTFKSRHEASERMETAERESAAMLDAAQREADELRDAAEREADELRAAAEREADALRAAADRRVREAEDEVAAIWQERERLVEDARDVAARLAEVADAAAEREPPPPIEATEGDTQSLPQPPVWDDDPDDEDEGPPAPALRAVPPPPPPAEASPEPSLADAPPPESDDFGPVAFELEGDAELGPMDEPAASSAVDEAAVPADETVESTPPFGQDEDEDDTVERPR